MDLRPSMLDELGILATMRWILREFQATHSSIKVERNICLEEKEIPEPLKIVIFRVLQETLNNIAKHSRAERVHLYLGKTDSGIELTVGDDGVGFDTDEALPAREVRRGLGIASIRERIELSGGSFHIESTRGRGTTIRAVWPENASPSIPQ
jgi:signal transduction histidine kinase